MAADVVAAGGTLSAADLTTYKLVRRTPVEADFTPASPGPGPLAGVPLTLFSAPPPSSGGAVVAFLLRLLVGMPPLRPAAGVGAGDALPSGAAGPYGALAEAFKHAYGRRTAVADPAFAPPVPGDVRRLLLSDAAVAAVRPLLGVFQTRAPDTHLPDARRPPLPTDGGTTHVSIVDTAGTAVAVTSTINTEFGSGVVSPTRGILLNNERSDFTLATDSAPVGVDGVEPGKHPLSSMSPSVLLGPGGAVVATVGGSGGPTHHHGGRAGAPARHPRRGGAAGRPHRPAGAPPARAGGG